MTVAEQKHEEDLQRIRGFRLLDDDFMTKCFDGNIECTELVLRIVLDMPDLEVLEVHTQYNEKNLQGRSVRLDVYASDSRGRKFNIEIQRNDKGAGVKRARYNSSVMDVNILDVGEEFEKLPETYVIFITENDVLGRNKPLYPIERCMVLDDETVSFGDGSHILYVNGAYRSETPLGKLMHDFSCTNPSDMNYKELADRARYFKEDKEGIAAMCKTMEDMRYQEREEMAARMIKKGKLSYEEIAEYAEISVERVKELAGKISA